VDTWQDGQVRSVTPGAGGTAATAPDCKSDKPADTDAVFIWRSQAADGSKGILVAPLESGVLFSLVFPDETAARKLTSFARDVADDRHTPVELVRFDLGEVLAEVVPRM
jgi:hypothetical protein